MKQNPKPFILLSEVTTSDMLKSKSRSFNPFICLVDFIVFTKKKNLFLRIPLKSAVGVTALYSTPWFVLYSRTSLVRIE